MLQLPKDFLNSLKQVKNFNEEALLKAHEQDPLPVSVRINPNKKAELDLEFESSVPWAENAYYLKERPVFTADPFFHAGCYYVQEASSMFIEYLLKQTVDFDKELMILDLCAAPGGKSTLINSLMNEKSLLVANEVIKSRADVLSYNLSKWGNCNFIVTNNDTKTFSKLNGVFDVAVVDAPCSGSGLFRKQHDAANEWSLESVDQCSIRQKKILEDVLPSLKTNGIVIYSTCSYSMEENESMIQWLLENQSVELVKIKIDPAWGIEDTGLGYRFYPYNLSGEGFFCTVLKVNEEKSNTKLQIKNGLKEVNKVELEVLGKKITLNDHHKVINHNNVFKLLNSNSLSFVNTFKDQFYFKQVGTNIGEIKHGELIPDHFLALSVYLKPEVAVLELEKEEALKYLKKLPFAYQQSVPGLKLIRYKGFGIGWAKVLSNRANNYLPQNYVIFNKEIGL